MVLKELKRKLNLYIGCGVQHTGWPCNSCFHSMDLDLKHDIHDYWEAVLDLRGDYDDYDWEKEWPDEDTSKFPERANELYHAVKGATNE